MAYNQNRPQLAASAAGLGQLRPPNVSPPSVSPPQIQPAATNPTMNVAPPVQMNADQAMKQRMERGQGQFMPPQVSPPMIIPPAPIGPSQVSPVRFDRPLGGMGMNWGMGLQGLAGNPMFGQQGGFIGSPFGYGMGSAAGFGGFPFQY